MIDKKVLEYIALLLKDIDANTNFYCQIEDKDSFKELLLEYIENHKQTIMNHIFANNDLAMKKYLLNNFIKPTLFPEQKQEQNISSIPQSPIIEIKPKGKGRPKGSKNKPKDITVNVPIHSVYDQTFLDAIKDILWYRSGITAKTIVDHLDCDESIVALIYGKISQYTNVHWKEKKIRNRNGKIITLYYPIEERKGYFYDGQIRSLTNLANHIGMNKITLWKRIKSGMNHIEAINKPIDDKMIRNAKKS